MKDEDNKPKLQVLEFKKPEPTETEDDISPDKVLDAAKGKMSTVIVLGSTQEGNFYFAMSSGSIAENLMLIEIAKAMMVEAMMGGMQDYD
jgi:hypothetical protein